MSIDDLHKRLQEREKRIAVLEQENRWLKKQVFGGGKSEKLDKNQLALEINSDSEASEEAPEQEVRYTRKKRKEQASKEETYDHLPVRETIIHEPQEVKEDPDAYEFIGEERTFEVGIDEAKLFRIEHVRRRYKSRLNKSTPPVIAPAPLRPVHGIASVSLLVHIILSKYCDHLPLFRQEKMFKRYGTRISRQNMSNWVNVVAEWLKPIYNHMRDDLIAGEYLQIDETPVKVIEPDMNLGKCRQAYLWPIARPGGDVIFSWSVTRGSAHLESLLEGFKGYLQSDGYSAYTKYIKSHEGIIPVGCNAHARRKFKEAQPEGEIPLAILKSFAELYAIESRLRKDDAPENAIRKAREDEAAPKWAKLQNQIFEAREEVLPQSLTGKACDYALANLDNLKRYLEHPAIEIDNNLLENAIRPSAIGKKNWLCVSRKEACHENIKLIA